MGILGGYDGEEVKHGYKYTIEKSGIRRSRFLKRSKRQQQGVSISERGQKFSLNIKQKLHVHDNYSPRKVGAHEAKELKPYESLCSARSKGQLQRFKIAFLLRCNC